MQDAAKQHLRSVAMNHLQHCRHASFIQRRNISSVMALLALCAGNYYCCDTSRIRRHASGIFEFEGLRKFCLRLRLLRLLQAWRPECKADESIDSILAI